MDFHDLKCFLAVAKLSSFTKAAEDCFISQSSLSKHISNVEKELHVKLIDRTKKQIALTEAGLILLHYSESMLDSYSNLLADLSQYQEFDGEQLTIACIPVMAQYNFTQCSPNLCGFIRKLV